VGGEEGKGKLSHNNTDLLNIDMTTARQERKKRLEPSLFVNARGVDEGKKKSVLLSLPRKEGEKEEISGDLI